jgi:hypothetical protein
VCRALLLSCLIALRLAAQTLELHSEFLRVDPQGHVLAVDAAEQPRELISPAVVRNGFASFHIVVRSDRLNYFLFVGTNPAGVLRAALYKEEFANIGGTWVPDALKPVHSPDFGVIPDPEAMIEGQRARAYLLDVWVPPETPAGKVRLEVQLKAGGWTIWPMEVRVLPALVPESRRSSTLPLPAPDRPSDESASAPLLQFVESNGHTGSGHQTAPRLVMPRSVREIIRRNAEQDLTLAAALDARSLVPLLKQKLALSRKGSEWYLGVRDLIYRLSSAERPGGNNLSSH